MINNFHHKLCLPQKYIKTINERYIKPKLLFFSELNSDFYPEFIAPFNSISITENELKKFDILSKPIDLFEKIDWYKDISSNKLWPKENYRRIKISYKDNSDIKYIWEIGRLQFLLQLGILYKKTKQEKYAERFKEIIIDFYNENSIKIGPNWKCTMDVAIRAVNLIYSYNYFKDSKSLDKKFWQNYFNELYKTGQFIFNNLEWAPVRGNHYLSDIVGLFYLGIVFKETNKGKKWLSFSQKELEKEIQLQITEDGVDFEGSTAYHRLVTELFLYTYIFGKDNNIKFSKAYIEKLKKSLYLIYGYTMNSGTTPQIGDNDNAQLLKLNNKRNKNDYRYLLQLSDIYFNTKYNTTNLENETIFFTNKKSIKKYRLKEICKSFSCGFNIFRNKYLFLLIKCGTKNQMPSGGHTHNDQLSFVLEYKNKFIITDPGTNNYTGNPNTRNQFRSTLNHNTITLDNQEQIIIPKNLFRLENRNLIKTNFFKCNKNKLTFEGALQKYPERINYKREIKVDLSKKEMIILDQINSNQFKTLKQIININPAHKINKKGNNLQIENINICFEKSPLVKESQYSEKYGQIQYSKKIVFETTKNQIITKIKLN